MSNFYASREAAKRRLGIRDTSQDVIIDELLESGSREIDQWTGRNYYVRTAVRTFTTPRTDRLLIPDLLAVTAIKTDTNGDLSYATTWEVADYLLLPTDNPFRSPPYPYWEIRPAPGGGQAFLTTQSGNQVTGRWGFYEVLSRATSALAGGVNSSTTTMPVDDGTEFEVGWTIKIDDEQMWIRSIDNNDLTVTRAVNGTTAAAHDDNDVIDVYTYPIISECCLIQVVHEFRARENPLGIIGGGDFPPMRISALHPSVRQKLQPFKRD